MNQVYFNNKYVESFIFDPDIQKRLTSGVLISPDFLIYLNSYLNLNDQELFIDDVLRNRILSIINYMRFSLNLYRDSYYSFIINEIICKLNNIDFDYSLLFYFDQANIRALDSMITRHDDKIERFFYMRDDIDKSICFDFEVLQALHKDCSEFSKLLPTYVKNAWFLCSIKGMYAEYSQMFDEDLVRTNLEQLLNANDKVLKKSLLLDCNQAIRSKILKR